MTEWIRFPHIKKYEGEGSIPLGGFYFLKFYKIFIINQNITL